MAENDSTATCAGCEPASSLAGSPPQPGARSHTFYRVVHRIDGKVLWDMLSLEEAERVVAAWGRMASEAEGVLDIVPVEFVQASPGPRVTLYRVVEVATGKVYWEHLTLTAAQSMVASWEKRRSNTYGADLANVPPVKIQAVEMEVIGVTDVPSFPQAEGGGT